MALESGVERAPALSRARDPPGRGARAARPPEAGALGPAGTRGIACGCRPGGFAQRVQVGSQFETAKEKIGFFRETARRGRQIQNQTPTDHTTKTEACTGPGNQGGRSIPPDGRPQAKGYARSSPAAGLPLARGRGLEEGAGPSQEGCGTQWDRLECLFLLSPPPAALSLEKPLKSSARL